MLVIFATVPDIELSELSLSSIILKQTFWVQIIVVHVKRSKKMQRLDKDISEPINLKIQCREWCCIYVK